MTVLDYLLIITITIGVIGGILYYLNRWASKRMSDQQSLIEMSKQSATIYVIDKKRDKIDNVNLPKIVSEQTPKYSKLMKMHFVKAKVGPQIMTLMCDKNVYNAIPVKKSLKVELAGIYIIGFAGMKTKEEMKQIKKDKKNKSKEK